MCVFNACGDGTVGSGEECDDRNRVDGDGCSSECLSEGQLTCAHMTGQLSCNTTFVATTYGAGSNSYDSYPGCGSFSGYGARELIYTFRTATTQTVRLQMFANTGRNPNLFVLKAGPSEACGLDMTCPAVGSSANPVEFVTFEAEAGALYAVVVDTAGAAPTNADDVWLSVNCGDAVCGDGVVQSPETCDAGAASVTGCGTDCRATAGFVCGSAEQGCTPTTCTDADRGGTRCATENLLRRGSTMTITGSQTSTDPSASRFSSTCTDSSYDPPYDAFTFRNTEPFGLNVTVNAAWNGDGFLVAYDQLFDPANPATNCIVGDDDTGGARNSQFSLVVPPGGRFTALATSFFNSPLGNYTLTVTVEP